MATSLANGGFRKDEWTMPEIDANDFIEELRFDIREKDLIKAKLVLSKIGAVDDRVRKMALFELNRADDAIAIPLHLYDRVMLMDTSVQGWRYDSEGYPWLYEISLVP